MHAAAWHDAILKIIIPYHDVCYVDLSKLSYDELAEFCIEGLCPVE